MTHVSIVVCLLCYAWYLFQAQENVVCASNTPLLCYAWYLFQAQENVVCASNTPLFWFCHVG